MDARISPKRLGMFFAGLAVVGLGACATPVDPGDQKATVKKSQTLVPAGPWSAGDQVGMANTLGQGTWMRCAYHLANPKAKTYEVSQLRSNTMPQSPFAKPLKYHFNPPSAIPGSRHVFNDEIIEAGGPSQQGTQMDALGHFAYLDAVWDGKGKPPFSKAKYYGGYTHNDVRPTDHSPLTKLGIENAPPIVTSAVLLDAKTHLGGGQPMKPGQTVTAKDIEAMIAAQGLGWRGLLPGDVLYIYTGWGDNWTDPNTKKFYYFMGPGLSYDAAKYIAKKKIVLVALDNPFTDPVTDGMLQGKAAPAEGTPPGLPFAIHHENLAVSGIHNIQNARLGEMARDKVWTSCTMILPLRLKGGSGSPIRPVAIGAPQQ